MLSDCKDSSYEPMILEEGQVDRTGRMNTRQGRREMGVGALKLLWFTYQEDGDWLSEEGR